jgi:uncharacterized protein YycO
MNTRRIILQTIYPLSRFVGGVHWPFVKHAITEQHVDHALRLCLPGDIMTTYTCGHLTNLFIPGDEKHLAICSSVRVVEAIADGVQAISLRKFMKGKDRVKLFRPRFCSRVEAFLASEWAFGMVGSSYDYLFEIGIRAFYCAELGYMAYEKTLKNPPPFQREEIMGEEVYMPKNIEENDALWKKIGEWP